MAPRLVRLIALSCLVVPPLASGCPESARGPASVLTVAHTDAPPTAQEFDFGPVLAHGQTLRHEFPLTNPTERPIRLLAAEALTPCCSAVGPLPASIPPGGTARLPIVLRPGHQSGRKRVRFVVRTDSAEWPVWWFAVDAALVSEVEAEPLDGSTEFLPMGRSGRQRFQILCRRIGEEGRGAPESAEIEPPLKARFRGAAVERSLPGGLIETTRTLEVDLPGLAEPGPHRAELQLRWADAETWRHSVNWRVTPHLRAVPSGLVFQPSAQRSTRDVILRSEDRPFQVLGVSGLVLAGPPDLPSDPKRSHHLRLVIDPSRASSEGASVIAISTDHPDQPTVTLSVLVLPAEREASQ